MLRATCNGVSFSQVEGSPIIHLIYPCGETKTVLGKLRDKPEILKKILYYAAKPMEG